MKKDEDDDTHLLYVDDSGTKEYSPTRDYDTGGNTRHFVFAGAFLTRNEARRITEQLRSLKRAVFKTENVEIKSNWLRLRLERQARFLRKFGLSEADLSSFVERYYGTILTSDLVLIGCVVDKVHMQEQYGDNAWYPAAAAYELLVQRAHQEIIGCGPGERCFSVIVDDMTGATPNGNQYRENLRRHHRQLKGSGSRLWPGLTFEHLRDLRFVNSRNSEMVQLVDLVAYNVYRQFREYGEEWETAGLKTLPTYDWFRRIVPKFRTGPNGRIQGYGVGKIPLLKRVRWRRRTS